MSARLSDVHSLRVSAIILQAIMGANASVFCPRCDNHINLLGVGEDDVVEISKRILKGLSDLEKELEGQKPADLGVAQSA